MLLRNTLYVLGIYFDKTFYKHISIIISVMRRVRLQCAHKTTTQLFLLLAQIMRELREVRMKITYLPAIREEWRRFIQEHSN